MMHKNSLDVYDKIVADQSLNKRERAVVRIVVDNPRPLRDYDILQKFKPGSDNINLCQPRITHLHDLKIFKEGPPGKSPYKNCNVRTTILNVEDQLSLF